MVRTVPANAQMKPPVVKIPTKAKVYNPYAKERPKTSAATWTHRWEQTAANNERTSHRKVVTVSPNANVTNANAMDLVGGTCSYPVPTGTIMPHPSNPRFFLPTQGTSSEDSSEDTESDDESEVGSRRISLSPVAPAEKKKPRVSFAEKTTSSATVPSARAPITATITFDDSDFVEGIIRRVSENIGDLMLRYYTSQPDGILK